jgi:hypothetical protein
MKSLRLTEVLLPLLAARAWAPWQVEPGPAPRRPVHAAPPLAAADPAAWRDRQLRRRVYDDVQ